jgi:hypothetical protein
MKTQTVPNLSALTIDHRTGLLKSIQSGAMRLVPFYDKAVFGPEVALGIQRAQHFGAFANADTLMQADFGRPCYSRGHGLKADEGLVEIGGKSPVVLYFKRLGSTPAMEALLFQWFQDEWLGTPTMELRPNQNSMKLRRNATAPVTQYVGHFLTRTLDLASQTLLALGYHLRAHDH